MQRHSLCNMRVRFAETTGATLKNHSLKTRYLYKLLANLVGLVVALPIQAFVSRGLGPQAYGDFHFLTSVMSQITAFLEMGTATCFYTKLSRRQKESGLILFYALILSAIIGILFLLVTCIQASGLTQVVWPEQTSKYIYFAAFWAVLMLVGKVCTQIGDAQGLTVGTEKIKIIQKIFSFIIIAGLFFTDTLSLDSFFFYHFVIITFLAAGQLWVVWRAGVVTWPFERLTAARMAAYGRECYHFSHPLVVYSLVALIVGVADRWLLQTFAGSAQQGFYSLAYQVGAICFLFAGAMTPILTREFSITAQKNDLAEMARLFGRVIPLIYLIVAYFSCFVAVHADMVTMIMGGGKFREAILPVAIMAFFPIHQTYGQLNASVFHATGQTRLYRNIGIVTLTLGLPVTYLLIADREMYGLQFGSVGLSVKMVLVQFLAVNVQLYFNARFLQLPFLRLVQGQLVVAAAFLAMGFFARTIAGFMIPPDGDLSMIIGFLVSGTVYSGLILALLAGLPTAFGLQRDDLKNSLEQLRSYVKR